MTVPPTTWSYRRGEPVRHCIEPRLLDGIATIKHGWSGWTRPQFLDHTSSRGYAVIRRFIRLTVFASTHTVWPVHLRLRPVTDRAENCWHFWWQFVGENE